MRPILSLGARDAKDSGLLMLVWHALTYMTAPCRYPRGEELPLQRLVGHPRHWHIWPRVRSLWTNAICFMEDPFLSQAKS